MQLSDDELFEVRQVFGFDALDQYIGCIFAGDHQRGPYFLFGMFVVQHFADAEGGGFFTCGVADAGATAQCGIDDPIVNALRRLAAQGGK